MAEDPCPASHPKQKAATQPFQPAAAAPAQTAASEAPLPGAAASGDKLCKADTHVESPCFAKHSARQKDAFASSSSSPRQPATTAVTEAHELDRTTGSRISRPPLGTQAAADHRAQQHPGHNPSVDTKLSAVQPSASDHSQQVRPQHGLAPSNGEVRSSGRAAVSAGDRKENRPAGQAAGADSCAAELARMKAQLRAWQQVLGDKQRIACMPDRGQQVRLCVYVDGFSLLCMLLALIWT